MAELKKLIPGETLMGIIAKGVLQSNGKILDTPHEYLFFYGNVVVMPDTNKTFHAPREKYLEYLNAFLDSKEGQRYERPSAEQIEKDIIACLGKPSLEPVNLPVSDAVDEQPMPDTPVESANDFSSIKSENDEEADETDAENEPEEPEPDPDDNSASVEEEREEEQDTASEVIEETHKKEKKKFSLFNKKTKVAPASPEVNTPAADTSWLDEMVEDENAYVSPKFYSSASSKAQDARIGKLSKQIKHLRTVALLLLVAAMLPWLLMGLGIMNIGPVTKTNTDEIEVISLVKDVKAGNVISATDIERSTIMRSQFDNLSVGTTVDSSGNVVQNYVQLWSNRNSIVGKYAADNLAAGDYLTAADYATLKNGLNMIEIDIDGTKVKVPVKATAAGTSDVRMYAIVTSRNAEGVTNSFALNLGELQFDGKSLKDVLNSNGNSILEELIQN